MPLLQSFSSSQSGDKPLIKGPGKRDTFHSLPGVRSSLLGPWHVPGVGWPGFQLADTLKKYFLNRCYSLHSRVNIRNTTQGIRISLTIGIRIQVPLTKNQESSTWFPESTTWNSESKTVLLIFHWFYFLKRINQLKTRAVSGPQLIDIAGI